MVVTGVLHTHSLSPPKAEAGGLLQVQGQPRQQREILFETSKKEINYPISVPTHSLNEHGPEALYPRQVIFGLSSLKVRTNEQLELN